MLNEETVKALKTTLLAGIGAAAGVGAIGLAANVSGKALHAATGNVAQTALQGVNAYNIHKQRQGIDTVTENTAPIKDIAENSSLARTELAAISDRVAAVAIRNNAMLPPTNRSVPTNYGIPIVDGSMAPEDVIRYQSAMMTGVGKKGDGKPGNPSIFGRF